MTLQVTLRPAWKHRVELEALEPKEETKREMPVWLHRKASKEAARAYKTKAAKCLKTKHRGHYARQLTELTANVPDEHRRTNFCNCRSYSEVSELGCAHPNECLETARKLIEAIAPGWRPSAPGDTGGTTPNTGAVTAGDQSKCYVVDTVRKATDLRDSIRIFTERDDMVEATALQTTEDETWMTNELVVYADGSCVNNGTAEARAGSGVWYGENDPRNLAIRVPGRKQSNRVGELLAGLRAVKEAPGNQPLRICSDSRFAIEGLTKHARDWEAKNWMGISHRPLFRCATAWLRVRTAKTTGEGPRRH